MDFIKEIIKLAHPGFSSQCFDDLDGLPCHSYLKQWDGKYLECTDEQAVAVGLSKHEELIGLTDFDLLNHQEAAKFRENDNIVIAAGRPFISTEYFTWFDGRNIKATSIKTPLKRKSSKKIIGVVGLSILQDLAVELTAKDKLYSLTRRQQECLLFLAKGYAVKQIASVMELSPRTVDHHLEAIKIKLGCYRRSDLIAKAMLIPAIRDNIT